MKILQFTPYLAPHKGGLEKVAETIGAYLVQSKHVEVINITSSIAQQPHIDQHPKIHYQGKCIGYHVNGYEVISVPSFEIVHNFPCPKFRTRTFRTIMRYLRHAHADIVQTHTRFFLQTLLGGLVAKWLKKPWVHIEHGSGYVKGYAMYVRFFATLFDSTIGRRVFRQSDRVVTISKANIPFIRKFTKKDITVIYNPIDYVPQKKEKNAIPHIGFVGRLVALKGVDILIRALKHIEDIPWKCTIVGEGDQREVLEKLTHHFHLSDRITFVGSDDRANRLPKFDIFVNPSYQEGLPTTVIEALLAHCVVVATDVGGTKEISDKQDLILVKPGDVKSLYFGLENTITNWEKITGSSKKYVAQKFDRKSTVVEYYDLYKKIIKR